MRLRALLFGLVAGVLLSAMRAPLGLDWTQVPARDAFTASLFRAAALIAVALFLNGARGAFRGGVRVWILLASATLGYALHGLFVAARWQPSGRLGYALLLLVLSFVLRVAAGRPERAAEVEEDAEEPTRLSFGERLGLVVAGAGVAIAFENLAHHVRLLGMGLPEDDTVIGTVFLAALSVGALAFGGLLSRIGRRPVLAIGLAWAAAGTLFGLTFVAGLEPDPLFRYLRRFGLDFSRIGTWRATALLAGASLVVPAFLAGSALSAARNASRLGSVVLGAAVGTLLLPYVVNTQARPLAPDEMGFPWAWNVLVVATAIAVVGALLVVAAGAGRTRWVASFLVLLALVLPFTRARLAVWILSPWNPSPIHPELVVPTAAGIVTVEHTRGGARIVTLDRKRMSPTNEELAVDALRMRFAFSLLDREAVPEPRVLLIGQMTPARAQLVQLVGPVRLERTAPWYRALEPVEAALFPSGAIPPGKLVTPAEARRRIRDGEYDLVVVLPGHGPVVPPKSGAFLPWGTAEEPQLAGLELPEGTVGVAWLDGNSPLAWRDWGERVLVALEGWQWLSIGIVRGEAVLEPGPERPVTFPAGRPEPRIPVPELLSTWPRERAFPLELAVTERLARAAAGGPLEALARGLALHYAAQEPSSPYETLAQQIELDEAELRAFHDSTAALEAVDPFSRALWEGLAWLLTQKRMPDLVLAYMEDLAERFAPWPVLDRALAQAYREFLEPAQALRFVDRALSVQPADVELLEVGAELALEADEPARAAEYAGRGLELLPESDALERLLGLALCRAGEPEGRAILERVLERDPEDEVVREALSGGPGADSEPPEDG